MYDECKLSKYRTKTTNVIVVKSSDIHQILIRFQFKYIQSQTYFKLLKTSYFQIVFFGNSPLAILRSSFFAEL